MASLATRSGVEGRQRLRIRTPLIHLTKAEIIRAGTALGRRLLADALVLRPGARRRGLRPVRCLRAAPQGLREAGVPDPTLYCG